MAVSVAYSFIAMFVLQPQCPSSEEANALFNLAAQYPERKSSIPFLEEMYSETISTGGGVDDILD